MSITVPRFQNHEFSFELFTIDRLCQSSYIMRTGLKEKLTVRGYQFHFKSIDYNIT